jgi:hypothetical protein
MEKIKEISATSGRISITLSLSREGSDCFVLITGGAVHLGATGYACGGKKIYSVNFPGHRDQSVVDIVIETIAPAVGGNLIVAAGIHYDLITTEEIAKVLEVSRRLAVMAEAFL